MSLLLNLEANVVIRDAGFNAQLAERLELAFSQSRQVDAKTVARGGVFAKVQRALVSWGAYVYLRLAGATGRY